MRVEPKALVRRLTPTATKMLEAAVARGASGRFYEVTVEHLLCEMLASDDSDCGLILRAFKQDRQRLLGRVERVLERMKTGNAGRPVFSENLFRWFEDAWLWASIEAGAARLRSGALFYALATTPGRHSAEDFDEIDAISAEQLKRDIEQI